MANREVVVITGASAGVGRATVREFARRRASIGLIKNHLPHKAQPVPPIYQPEVAARAIYYATHHPDRREYYASWSTVKAIFGNKLDPFYADRYLARTGYASQEDDGPEDPNRPFNLWQPVSGDHGAHGTFDARSREHSLELWLETHLGWTTVGALGLLTALALWLKEAEPQSQVQHKQAR
jgi:hypothetical protein